MVRRALQRNLLQARHSLRTAKETGLLLIVGTSGATNLPRMIVEKVLSHQGIVIDINPKSNYFSDLLEKKKKKNGYTLKGPASEVLPELVAVFRELMQA